MDGSMIASILLLANNGGHSLELIQITQGMESLRKVKITNCGGLSIPPSGLQFCTSLQVLTVSDCPLLTSIPITQGMPSLRELEIACAGLSSLPTGLRFCTSLEILRIRGGCFSTLPSISFTRVLRILIIMDCLIMDLTKLLQLEICAFHHLCEVMLRFKKSKKRLGGKQNDVSVVASSTGTSVSVQAEAVDSVLNVGTQEEAAPTEILSQKVSDTTASRKRSWVWEHFEEYTHKEVVKVKGQEDVVKETRRAKFMLLLWKLWMQAGRFHFRKIPSP
ncbi:hypothetical protein M0R45_020369 [Rubus argutus]|uniref:Uncharacterized protein n=1 Tax=Rubus argutus TaxID=59490 RepID=A0AAW1XAJ8_RUBAR